MKKILLLAVAALSTLTLKAQNNPVILEVGGQQIRQDEFMHDFWQSTGENLTKKKDVTAAEKRAALDEYVELYANFRAKLMDAYAEGLDTSQNLNKELRRYRKDLAAPYLIDSAMLQTIMHEAYERNRYALHAAHILVRVDADAAPEDTLAAYQRALELRERVVKGEDFFAVAVEEMRRTNPRAQVHPNEGELSFFSAFDMVYPFENAAYALQVGEISQPVRTRFGYHIIKLFDRVEMYGKVTLQHIWLRNTGDQRVIGMYYQQLLDGTSFDIMARQSDDHTTSETGGYIRDASLAQLPQEYVVKLSELNEGEFSKPFLTRYGWHIVKLIKKDTLPPFESMVPYYKQRMTRDQRGQASRKSFAANSRVKYNIVDYTSVPVANATKKKGKAVQQPVEMMASLDEFVSKLNDTVFSAKWRYRDTMFHDLRTLVSVPGKDYNVLDFARFIRRTQRVEHSRPFAIYAKDRYAEFLDSVTIAYADSQLEKEYPDFAALVEEYRRGLIIFNYNDMMIWTKAINDSVGFADFYNRESKKKDMQNPDDSIYFWRTRARVVVFDVADNQCLDAAKATKIIEKSMSKNLTSTDMKEALLKKVDRKHCDIAEPVEFSLDVVEEGHQQLLAPDQWKRGVYTVATPKGYKLLAVQDILAPCLKEQMEARGYYLNAWQNEVEKELCRDLRAKYNVKIHHDAVSKITY